MLALLKQLSKRYWPLVVMVPTWFIIYYAVNRLNKRRDADFANATIKEKLTSCALRNHGFWIEFRLANNQVYTFATTQKGSQVSGAEAFLAAAAYGDSIRKDRQADTLLLVKKDKTLKFPLVKAY